jgi:hypothetical protein
MLKLSVWKGVVVDVGGEFKVAEVCFGVSPVRGAQQM